MKPNPNAFPLSDESPVMFTNKHPRVMVVDIHAPIFVTTQSKAAPCVEEETHGQEGIDRRRYAQ